MTSARAPRVVSGGAATHTPGMRLSLFACALAAAATACTDPTRPSDTDAAVADTGAPTDLIDASDGPPPEDAEPDATAPGDTSDGVDSLDVNTVDTLSDDADATAGDADAVIVPPPPPPSLTLTVNRIPAPMSGAVPWRDTLGVDHPFALRVHDAYATLDVLADLRAGGPVDWSTLSVSCTADGAPWPLGPFTADADGRAATLAFGPEAPLPAGARLSCLAGASGPGGAAAPSAITFDAAPLPPELDPFPAVDRWLVVLSRDLFAIAVEPDATGAPRLVSHFSPDGNGAADFGEAFVHLGLVHPDHPDAAAIVEAHLVRRIREHAYAIFGLDADGGPTPDGVRLRLYFEGDPGAPTPADFAAGDLSLIALGGDGAPSDQAQGTFGRALVDWNNQERENNAVYGLGVFPTALVRAVLAQPLGVYLLADLLPSEGGVPIGGHPSDALFIGLDPDDVPALPDDTARHRAQLYALGVDLGALALASILTHEIGHSLGLVPYGPPPQGLFAGVDGPSFLASFAPDAHIDTAGLNIMQTGGSVDWTAALGEDPRFNALNWAYLRRQLVVGPQP